MATGKKTALFPTFNRHLAAVLAVVDQVYQQMEAAHKKRNPADEAEIDAEFHLAIIEASHNVVMLHMMRSMYEMLRQGVFYNRRILFHQRATRTTLLEQHRVINEALQSRNAAAARAAVEAHMDFVRVALTEYRKSEKNEKIAQQRLAYAKTR